MAPLYGQHARRSCSAPQAGPGAPSPAPNLDRCLIGTWKGIHETTTGYIGGQPAQYVGRGATQTFRPNGSAKADYGKRMVYRTTLNGNVWTDVFSGYVTYHWRAKNGAEHGSHYRGHGTSLLFENGVLNNSLPLTLAKGPERYTCSGNSLEFFANSGTVTLARVLPKPQVGS
jgi:molecular chaperone DnaK